MLDLYIKSILTVSDMESLQVIESQGADSGSNYNIQTSQSLEHHFTLRFIYESTC